MRNALAVRRSVAALAAGVALALSAWLVVRLPKAGFDEEFLVFWCPDVSPDDARKSYRRLVDGKEPLPSGIFCVRWFDGHGSFGWRGRRRYGGELLVNPGEFVHATLTREGREELRFEGLDGRRSLPFTWEVPFWGTHAYRLTVETTRGESSYAFELPGTVALDL
jgi:hypothetical protein